MMTLLNRIVPEHKMGTKTGAIVHINCSTATAAQKMYEDAAERLLDINRWGIFAGSDANQFCITDNNGGLLPNNKAKQGYLVRIKLPAPGNKSGSGYDWVRIEKIEVEGNERDIICSTSIRVRPEANPKNETQNQAAHFYTNDATSTFSVIRKGKAVWALELGRNEIPNTSVSIMNSIRNFMIAIAARLGFAKTKWKALLAGILNYKRA